MESELALYYGSTIVVEPWYNHGRQTVVVL